jgi:hypothetical protein
MRMLKSSSEEGKRADGNVQIDFNARAPSA